jgi:CRP/FNR family cyclic AMP-dependent transcriptional regulator
MLANHVGRTTEAAPAQRLYFPQVSPSKGPHRSAESGPDMHPLTPTRAIQDCSRCEHRSLRMFCNLDVAALAEFTSIGAQTRLPRGTTLFTEDAPSDHVYVICSGQVKLSCTSREGRTLILKIAVPGDVLGLGAVISGSKYEVTAETIEPTQVNCIRRDDFLTFVERHGQGSLHAARALSEEYKSAFFDARRLALSGSAAGRLAGVLLGWGKAAAPGEEEMRFTMALTHEELGSLAGISRETVTRVLGRFRKEKLIQIRGSSMTLLAPARLEELSA